MARHFAAALIRRKDPVTGVRQVLIIHYYPVRILSNGRRVRTGQFQIKFAGGKGEGNETPRQTVRRECIPETGLIIRGHKEFCELVIPDGPQYFFLAEFDRCKGKLRTKIYHDQRADLGPPRWADEDKIGPLLFGNHGEAFRMYKKQELELAQNHI